ELQEVRHAHRREARLLDGGEVPAAALHVENVLLLAHDVAAAQLHRGVAPAVEHERGLAPEQARGVDAQSERVRAARRLGVVPEILHEVSTVRDRTAPAPTSFYAVRARSPPKSTPVSQAKSRPSVWSRR